MRSLTIVFLLGMAQPCAAANYYQLLNVSPQATPQEIADAAIDANARNKVLDTDSPGEKAEKLRRQAEIAKASEVLMDGTKRSAYDFQLFDPKAYEKLLEHSTENDLSKIETQFLHLVRTAKTGSDLLTCFKLYFQSHRKAHRLDYELNLKFQYSQIEKKALARAKDVESSQERMDLLELVWELQSRQYGFNRRDIHFSFETFMDVIDRLAQGVDEATQTKIALLKRTLGNGTVTPDIVSYAIADALQKTAQETKNQGLLDQATEFKRHLRATSYLGNAYRRSNFALQAPFRVAYDFVDRKLASGREEIDAIYLPAIQQVRPPNKKWEKKSGSEYWDNFHKENHAKVLEQFYNMEQTRFPASETPSITKMEATSCQSGARSLVGKILNFLHGK